MPTSSDFSQQKSIPELHQQLTQQKQCLANAEEAFQKASEIITQITTRISLKEKKCMTLDSKLLSPLDDNVANALREKKTRYEKSIAQTKQKLEPHLTKQEELAIDIAKLKSDTYALQKHLSQRKAHAFNEAIAQAMRQQHPF